MIIKNYDIFFSITVLKNHKSILNCSVNGKYIFIVIANDEPSKKLSNILKLKNKTKFRKEIFIFFIILYDNSYYQLQNLVCFSQDSYICLDKACLSFLAIQF